MKILFKMVYTNGLAMYYVYMRCVIYRYDCDEYNPCADEPCVNGGMCNSVDGRYICACSLGFYGRHCERTNVCELESPCGPHAENCQVVGIGGYACICHEGNTLNISIASQQKSPFVDKFIII